MYRKAEYGDCEGVYDLICELESRQLPFPQFSTIFQDQLNSSRYHCIVCERNGHVAGVLNLRFEGQLHHGGWVAEIMEFAVEKAGRGQGIGKELFALACRAAEDFGCEQIEVASNQMRAGAHRFYIREGMENTHFKFSKTLLADRTGTNHLER